MLNSLSGRFLILTVLFVMIAEVLIFVPSIARYRLDYLTERMERAQIASLALLAAGDMIDADVQEELLVNAGVLNVVLRRDSMRQLILASDLPGPVTQTVDLRDPSPPVLIRDALRRFAMPGQEVIRVIGEPANGGGQQIEIALDAKPLHDAMIEYGLNILVLSAVISAITAAFLFLAVRRMMVLPVKGLVREMDRFADSPEDARSVIVPDSRILELREAESSLQSLETQLMQSLRQKERLAQLGGAVAKIAHDLRNILTTATLLGDRLERVDDPTVQRVAPKLVASLGRAVNLTEGTLAFGRAEESPPRLEMISATAFLEEVCDSESLALAQDSKIVLKTTTPPAMTFRADREQMLRVVGNLVRNALQALTARGGPGHIHAKAHETAEAWIIEICDDGPGLPPKARDNLFEAFKGTVRKGGTGLGLAIAAELVRGHGGRLSLARSDDTGTVFCISLPKGEVG